MEPLAELLYELRKCQIEIADWNERMMEGCNYQDLSDDMMARWRSISALLKEYEPKG